MDSVKGRDILGCYTINGFAQALQVWFKEAIVSQTRVINFFLKYMGQMFPKWDFDVEDTLAENIIKLMFVKKPWKWTMDCWEVTGTWVNTNPTVVSPAKKKLVKRQLQRLVKR
ncbi:BnaCnng61950D [Brassica napus]|uniref:BnaCnng61950D protein n=1 Tax=Brassica napus TaxID=3708 RepID=A0A078JU21_BRANA|nr:BnaCnng61950D [Brassica napus]